VKRLNDTAQVRDLAVSPGGTTVAMTDYDGRVILRGVHNGRRMVLKAGPMESYASVDFSVDGRTVFQYKDSHELALWDAESGLLLGAWQYADASFAYGSTLAVSPDGTVLTIGHDGTIFRWITDARRWRNTLCGMRLDELTKDEQLQYLQGVQVEPMCKQ
jgi:hypothetical protein